MSELLKRRRRVAEVEVRCYISQLMTALKYMHGVLVIHRDLKLGNLFLDSDLRVKVGDFGLAAKLNHPNEKRKTICGTPNYIAPEILEGKDGHSYEVDIWSAGVVMYTLLVGTPPFESKDVKSTYKRILCNNYSFPEHIHISDDAKNLIRSILQNRPENRPSLDAILNHSFFTRSANSIPSKLPESALFCTPQKHQLTFGKALSVDETSSTAYGDENDPGAINRIRQPAAVSQKCLTSVAATAASQKGLIDRAVEKKSALTGVITNMKSLKEYFTSGSSAAAQAAAESVASSAPVTASQEGRLRTSGGLFPAIQLNQVETLMPGPRDSWQSKVTGRDSRESSFAPIRGSIDKESATGPVASTGGLLSARSTAASVVTTARVSTRSQAQGQGHTHNNAHDNKFEIYQDAKDEKKAVGIPALVHAATGSSSSTSSKSHHVHATATGNHISMPVLNTKPTLSKSPHRVAKGSGTHTLTSSTARSASDDHHLTSSAAKKRHSAVSFPSSSSGGGGVNVNQIETDLQNVHLDHRYHSTRSQTAVTHTAAHSHSSGASTMKGSSSASSKGEKTPTSLKRRVAANSATAASAAAANTDTGSARGNKVKRKSADHHDDHSPARVCPNPHTTVAGAAAAAAAVMSTPAADQAQRKKYSRTPGTLEAMHDMLALSCPDNLDDDNLNNSYMVAGNMAQQPGADQQTVMSLGAGGVTSGQSSHLSTQAAQVWVVRYVDYTSKYGLGFLLNTGSVGVYFNDSTKVILSASGEIFQYFERKRNDVNTMAGPASVAAGAGVGAYEQTTQTHSIRLYPIELQKKVTLLIHFRNYLTDSNTVIAKTDGSSSDANGNAMEELMRVRLPVDATTTNAASASVKYGTNSAVYIPSKHAAVPCVGMSMKSIEGAHCGPLNTSIESPASSTCRPITIHSPIDVESVGNSEMTYLKKWVRTRHAILFRLSNRTVQVVFFDRSEVLLSSEARVITYVSKQGERSHHCLSDVLQTGRKDIAKRLKYTKDIMYRLITIQQPK